MRAPSANKRDSESRPSADAPTVPTGDDDAVATATGGGTATTAVLTGPPAAPTDTPNGADTLATTPLAATSPAGAPAPAEA